MERSIMRRRRWEGGPLRNEKSEEYMKQERNTLKKGTDKWKKE